MCDGCFRSIPRQSEQVCPRCYEKSEHGTVCKICRAIHPDGALDGLIAACSFAEKSLLQKTIHAFKYDFVETLAGPLSALLIEALEREHFQGDFVLSPVPLHKKRLRWRGFNQAELLAKNVAGHFHASHENLLFRIIYNKPQMELSREQRLKNVRDAFIFSANAVPENVLLLDDVATTLSTLNACASALKKAGVKKVYGIVLARVY